MSLPLDAAPPRHVPPASTPPWPVQPPPHGAAQETVAVRRVAQTGRRAVAPLIALGAAGLAAVAGLALAAPRLLRTADRPAAKRRHKRAKA